MKILILVDCYLPSTRSCAKLVHDLAVALVAAGHCVVILCPDEEQTTISSEDAISVLRIKAGKIKGVNKIRRAMNEARLSTILWRRAGALLRRNRCEMILFYSPTIFFGPLVRRLKKLWQCPAYLILRDIFPDWALDTGVLRRGLIYKCFSKAASAQYEAADVIALQSPSNLACFVERHPEKSPRLRVLFNWTSLSEDRPLRTNYREQLGLQGKCVLFYGGNIGVAQDIDNIVRAALRLRFRSDIHFLLVGEGTDVPRVRRLIARQGLRNIHLLPAVDQDEYLSIISEFDVGLISLDARLKSHNIPGKLLSYLHCGMPVVASVNPGNDLFGMLNDNQAGFCFVNGDDDSFDSAVIRFADEPGLRFAMGRNASHLLKGRFSAEAAVTDLFSHLHEMGLGLPLPHVLPSAPAQLERYVSRRPAFVSPQAEVQGTSKSERAAVSSLFLSLRDRREL